MLFQKNGVMRALFLPVLLFFVYSNANEIDLVQSGIVSVETMYSECLLFQTVKVTYDNNILTVKGYVALKRITIQGHFEITIISPENEVIEKLRTKDRYYNKKRNRKIKFFSVESPVNPPKGSRVLIVFREKLPEEE